MINEEEIIDSIETEYGVIDFVKPSKNPHEVDPNSFYRFLADLLIRNEQLKMEKV